MDPLDRPTAPSEALKLFLDSADWGWGQNQRAELVHTTFRGVSGTFSCTGLCLDEEDRLLFYCLAPFRCPEDLRAEAAAFVARANWGLQTGCFELDLDDGELRFRATSHQRSGITPNEAGDIAYAACRTMDRYLPGFAALVHAGATAEEAVRMVEG